MIKADEGTVVMLRNGHTNFVKNSIDEGRPANLIIVVDANSDTFSGQLEATGGLTGENTTLTLPDLVENYVGESILQETLKASTYARAYSTVHEISPGHAPWADITPRVRGGWRVMVMVSCGSAVRQRNHWKYITELFQS
jgi:hypothetical protein